MCDLVPPPRHENLQAVNMTLLLLLNMDTSCKDGQDTEQGHTALHTSCFMSVHQHDFTNSTRYFDIK